MQLDNSYLIGTSGVLFTKRKFNNCLGDNIKLEEEEIQLKHHGWFLLKYIYIPKRYTVFFEVEFNSFSVRITNEDGGFTSLNKFVKFENDLRKKNVEYAIDKLRELLDSEINFYKTINNHLYKQINGEYKRVKFGRDYKNEK